MDKKEILKYVRKCDRELIDTLAQHYGSQSTYEQEHLPNKRKYLANVIADEKDSKVAEKLKLHCEELAELQEDLEKLKEQAQELKKNYKNKEIEIKEAKEAIANTKIIQLQKLQKDLLDKKQVKEIQSKYEELEKTKQAERDKKIRENQRKKAIVAYSEGVLAALIDGVEAEFAEETNKVVEITGKYYEKMEETGELMNESYSAICEGLKNVMKKRPLKKKEVKESYSEKSELNAVESEQLKKLESTMNTVQAQIQELKTAA